VVGTQGHLASGLADGGRGMIILLGIAATVRKELRITQETVRDIPALA
jgi:hypothetical protein